MIKKAYTNYIQATNVDGSGKASSYVKALDWLCQMLVAEPFSFSDCKNIWAVDSVSRLHELYLFVLAERRTSSINRSAWNVPHIPKSYLQGGYCSAALKSLIAFHIEYAHEQKLLGVFDRHKADEAELAGLLEVEFASFNENFPGFLLEGMDLKQGKEAVREVSVRLNQNLFRKMILGLYNQSCCITGLNIPEVNRASHIVPWAENSTIRLDPRNGLCLSATYDAAFDRNLISLDDDYRIIISNQIRDHYSHDSVKTYFIDKEGDKISLPSAYLPHRDYLSEHRAKGDF